MSEPPPNLPPTPSQVGIPEKIGPYRVEREVGRGGMGLVYLARDPRLDRPVAIKVLPDAFAADPARLARFEREARTLAALNHQNVAAIYGLEEHDHRRVLVLEFVPGNTLGRLLERGPLPVDEALRIAMQIAEGLEAAHERGIVHRDLKPENVKVTPEGIAKVLDFGLASNVQSDISSASTATRSPGLTQQGMVIGTPGYMSPEQARGLTTDRRTDIWALGCVLFELLSGAKAFPGETATDALAAVLDREPDFTRLPPVTPGRIRDLLRKCLAKDARKRLRDAGDARIEIEEALSQPLSGWFRIPGDRSGSADEGTFKPRPVARLSMLLAPTREISNLSRSALAVAPDGSAVVFVSGVAPDTQLFVRRFEDIEAKPIPGTLGAESPTFSPDGTRLAFFADGRLKRVALAGGAPVPLAPAPRPQGVCWGADECIYFVPDWQKPVLRIHAGGGSSSGGSAIANIETVAEPDLSGGEIALLCPELLPGGKHLLCAAYGGRGRAGASSALDESPIVAIDLRTLQRKPLIHAGANPRYVASGHLLFTRGGSLFAAPFDPERLEVLGTPAQVITGILGNALGGSAHCGFSIEGTMAYAPGEVASAEHTLLLAARSAAPGTEPVPAITHRGPFVAPAIAPAGPRRVALQVMGPTDQLWVHDLDSGAATQLTFHADNSCPVWSPDGQYIAFRSNMGGRPELYRIPADGSSPPELLLSSDGAPVPTGFSPDGALLIFTRARPAGGTEIWSVKVGEPASARPVVQIALGAWGGTISPDARFLAFVSEQSGRPEVYVQPMSAAGAPNPQRWQVTSGGGGAGDGGHAPIWSRAGGELFYRSQGQVICSRVAVEPSFQLGRPRTVAQGAFLPATPATANYDVSADGQSVFVLRARDDAKPARELRVILNWFDELNRLSPHSQQVRATPASRIVPPRPSYNSSAGTLA